MIRRIAALTSMSLLIAIGAAGAAGGPEASAATAYRADTSLGGWHWSTYDGLLLGYFAAKGYYVRQDDGSGTSFDVHQGAKWWDVHGLVDTVRFRHATDCHRDRYDNQVNSSIYYGPLRGETTVNDSDDSDLSDPYGWVWDPFANDLGPFHSGDSRYRCRVIRHRFYVTYTRWNSARTKRFDETFEMIEYGRFG